MDERDPAPQMTMRNFTEIRRGLLRTWVAPVITLVIGAIIVTLTYYEGLRRGMDHAAMFGPESEQAAIAIALSDLVYDLNAGYLGYASVRDKLVSVWNRGAKHGHDPILLENNKNKELLDAAISAAASLGPQPPGFVGDRSLITTVYDDIGYVDYVKLSFRLFGLRFKAFYDTFFVLLALSAAGFLWTFRSDVPAQVVLLFTLFAFAIEPHTSIFTSNMPTFAGLRHGSTLALIPMWYFTFLLFRGATCPVPPPWRTLKFGRAQALGLLAAVIALFQLALLILAIKIRGSAVWSAIFVISLGVAIAILPWWRTPSPRSYRLLLRELCAWPTILVIGGLFLHSQYMKIVLHPVYFTDDVMPSHGLWHSAYIGLILYAPGIVDTRVMEIARASGYDAAAYAAGSEYVQRVHFLPPGPPGSLPIGYMSPWTGAPKARLDDEIMRRAFLEMAAAHSLKVAEMYILTKPQGIYAVIEQIIERTPNLTWLWLSCLGGLVGGLLLAQTAERLESGGHVILPVAAAIPFAALPNIWAYPAFQTISDLFLMSLALFQTCIALTLMLAFRLFQDLERKRKGPSATPRQ